MSTTTTSSYPKVSTLSSQLVSQPQPLPPPRLLNRSLPRSSSSTTLLSPSNPAPNQSSTLNGLGSPTPSSVSLSKLGRLVAAKRRQSDSEALPIAIPNQNQAVLSPAASFLSMFSRASVSDADLEEGACLSYLSVTSGILTQKHTTARYGIYSEGDQFDVFTLGKEIGHGAFSRVFEASTTSDPSAPKVAIKIIRKPNISPPPSPILNSLGTSFESLSMKRHISIPSLTSLQAQCTCSFVLFVHPVSVASKGNSDRSEPGSWMKSG
ncbi:hypothetical protein BCR33DRAFT_173871 [Rhizoclosmatium globosum]|uniref:Protein kinase domain-containing protein n=1 Tax=Rhizoclosmatium globosum TaxID=329046 RepID=A0A1Y2CFC7_9FUNG|nr:hypothetical protein BCR33DRAFT_173871 [Rhizoclosmatium globosum]|eukprot:ORY45761.1 hypothetical protein BCR33DRAFT_173871 [Rhizoclosmatium globosum]